MPDPIEIQKRLEELCLSSGARRFRKKLEKAKETQQLSGTGATRSILLQAFERVELAVAEMCNPTGRGKRHVAVKITNMVGTEEAAYFTLKACLDVVGTRTPLRKVAMTIAGYMLDELRFRRFRESARGLFEYRMKSFSTSNYQHMKRSLDATMAYAEVDVRDINSLLTLSGRMRVGVKLIDLLIEHTGLFKIVKNTIRKGKGFAGQLYLEETESTRDWIEQRNEVLEFRAPVNLPMAIPPRDWSMAERGGYWFAMRDRYGPVRAPSGDMTDRGKDFPCEAPVVWSTLNRIQAVPWKLNRHVLDVVMDIHDRGLGFANIPTFVQEPVPNKPVDIDTNEEARQIYRRTKHAWFEREHARKVRAVEFTKVLSVIEQIQDLPRFWFPWNYDFRGRLYPIPNYLTPQGDDLSKALLVFADGKPLGKQGVSALAVHGANMLDETPDGEKLSKASLTRRIEWVHQNSQRIADVAASPLTNRWWLTADKPLQFLAFCYEWAGYLAEGTSFVSSLPVAMDGSCNGIQHFSALLRDPVGAEAVNMTSTEEPKDLYSIIASDVIERLDTLSKAKPSAAHEPNEPCESTLANSWIRSGLVNRKLCKRPTMTFGYGSKKYGFQEQLVSYLKDLARSGETVTILPNEYSQHCQLMARLIWEALESRVVAAYHGMEWMQKAVRMVIASTHLPVTWTAPTGFHVRQDYFTVERERVKTILAGEIIKPSVYHETDEVNTVKQANAVAPNYVHSLDAAHLAFTVQEAAEQGVEAFAMVHDSFATLAADRNFLAYALRRAFIKMYRAPLIEDLYAELLAQYEGDEELPEPPTEGRYEIEQIMDADYFFA